MKFFREDIWQDGEYTYEAAYGFVPNLHFYLHEDDGSERSETTVAAYSDSQCSDSSAAAPNQTETAGAARPFMLVVPGGGYCMVVPPEGEVVAKEFYDRGMNCAVLTYTTDITFAVPLRKQPLNDISRDPYLAALSTDTPEAFAQGIQFRLHFHLYRGVGLDLFERERAHVHKAHDDGAENERPGQRGGQRPGAV